MPNMMEYVALVGDQPLDVKPWQPLDSLVMANVCYNKLGALAATHAGMPLNQLAPRVDLSPFAHLPYHEERKALLFAMAATERYGTAAACCYLDIRDNSKPIQFSAVTMLTRAGVVVCFRGTDNTITGWREDLYMSFESPVPGQAAAVAYLNEIARRYPGPIIITGHSKGGNLSAYAAAHANEDVQQRILCIDCFDSPGLDDATLQSEGYARVKHLIRCYIPQDSVIGLLMRSDLPMTVVKSTAAGLKQHDCFSWQVDGEDFVTLPANTFGSRFTDQALDLWLKHCTPEQRRVCVDAVFDLLDATNADTLTDMKAGGKQSLTRILTAARSMDAETLPVFLQLAASLLQSGAMTAIDMASASQLAAMLRNLVSSLPVDQLKQLISTLPIDQLKHLGSVIPLEQLLHRLTGFVRDFAQRLPRKPNHEEGDDHDVPKLDI